MLQFPAPNADGNEDINGEGSDFSEDKSKKAVSRRSRVNSLKPSLSKMRER